MDRSLNEKDETYLELTEMLFNYYDVLQRNAITLQRFSGELLKNRIARGVLITQIDALETQNRSLDFEELTNLLEVLFSPNYDIICYFQNLFGRIRLHGDILVSYLRNIPNPHPDDEFLDIAKEIQNKYATVISEVRESLFGAYDDARNNRRPDINRIRNLVHYEDFQELLNKKLERFISEESGENDKEIEKIFDQIFSEYEKVV